MPSLFAVITTIQAPTPSVLALRRRIATAGAALIAIGDRKTPEAPWREGADLVSIEDQLQSDFTLARALPENHYSRKNIGYLQALRLGATAIFDTDDDNSPLEHWLPREVDCAAREVRDQGWFNVYASFTSEYVWPRGFPLEALAQSRTRKPRFHPPALAPSPVQQSLVNGSPDVDAIWRLLHDHEFHFEPASSLRLGQGVWCPFNSQSTWWFPAAYRLLYLPSHVSFRMTDIWRSFVAQRCLWEMGYCVTFHSADMIQDRNPHDLLRDLEQEIPGFLFNERIRRCLEELSLSRRPDATGDNLLLCYEALTRGGFAPPAELPLVELWLRDLEAIGA